MTTREVTGRGFVAYFRAKWDAQADGFRIGQLYIKADGDEVVYTSTATKEEPCSTVSEI